MMQHRMVRRREDNRMDEMLFPEQALAILREARWDPDATRSFEIMAGGFHWSDERLLGDAASACLASGSWAFRYLIGYRASLIRGVPREALRAAWDHLSQECPHWPGFRPERMSPALAAELDRESRRTCIGLRRLERKLRNRGACSGEEEGRAEPGASADGGRDPGS
jgi:hypothetical protein